MNDYQQQEKFQELKKELDRLNAQFEQTMSNNNLTNQDLILDEKTLPKEIQLQWEKMKSSIEQNHIIYERLEQQHTKSLTSLSRKNALRL